MDKNKTFTIDIAELEFSRKETARIGVMTGVTICSIVGLSAILVEGASKLKKKYYRWKLKKDYKKLYYQIMNDPRFTDEEKSVLKEKVGPYIESK